MEKLVSFHQRTKDGDALLRLGRAELLEKDAAGIAEEGVLELLARLPVLRGRISGGKRRGERGLVQAATWASPGRGRRRRSQQQRSRRRYHAKGSRSTGLR